LWLGLAAFAGMGAVAKGKAMYQSAQIQALDDLKNLFSLTNLMEAASCIANCLSINFSYILEKNES
jgi:type III secretory pathway component EscU